MFFRGWPILRLWVRTSKSRNADSSALKQTVFEAYGLALGTIPEQISQLPAIEGDLQETLQTTIFKHASFHSEDAEIDLQSHPCVFQHRGGYLYIMGSSRVGPQTCRQSMYVTLVLWPLFVLVVLGN